MSDTPRTDALIRSLQGTFQVDMIVPLTDHARDLERALAVRRAEAAEARAKFDACVSHLSHIYALIQAEDVVLPDGRRFKFTPSDEHVRTAWEGLSKAIREIPAAIEAARNPTST